MSLKILVTPVSCYRVLKHVAAGSAAFTCRSNSGGISLTTPGRSLRSHGARTRAKFGLISDWHGGVINSRSYTPGRGACALICSRTPRRASRQTGTACRSPR